MDSKNRGHFGRKTDKQLKNEIAGLSEQALEAKMKNLTAATSRSGKKGRGQRARVSRNRDTIRELMTSLNTKPKFTKMVEYSVECLKNLAVDEASVDEMIEEGVLDVLAKILKLNPFNEKIQRMVNLALKSFAKTEKQAQAIVEKIGVATFVRSLEKHVEVETIESTSSTIASLIRFEKKSADEADQFVSGGAVPALCSVVHAGKSVAALAGSIESLNRISEMKKSNAVQIMEQGVAEGVLKALEEHPENPQIVAHGISLIGALARADPANMETLKKMGAVDVIVQALDFHADNEEILALGARALECLADVQDVDSVLRVQAGNNLMTAKAILKLSNLLLVGENVDFLTKNNGIPWLIAAIRNAASEDTEIAKKIVLGGCRALQRLAVDEQRIYGMLQHGAVKLLVSVIKKHAGDEERALTAQGALMKMLSRKENATYIIKSKAVPASMAILAAHPSSEKVAAAVSQYFQKMSQFEDAVPFLMNERVGETVIDLINKFSKSDAVCQAGMATIAHLAITPENMLQMMTGSDGLQSIVNILKNHNEDLGLTKQALTLVKSAAMVPENVKPLQDLGAVDAILGAVEKHPDDDDVQELGAAALAMISGKHQLKSSIDRTSEIAQMIIRNPGMAKMQMSKLMGAVKLMSSLTLVDANLEEIIRQGGVQALMAAFVAATKLPPGEQKGNLLRLAAEGLVRLGINPQAAAAMVREGGLQAMLRAALADIGNEDLAESAVELALLCAADPANIAKMVSDGNIQDLVGIARAYPLNEKILNNVTKAFGLMAADASAIVPIVKAGGAEVVVESMFANMNNPHDLLQSLGVLQHLTTDPSFVQAAIDAGGLDGILEALRKFPDNIDIQKSCMSVLCNLLISEAIGELIGSKGGIPLIIGAMDRFKSEESLVEVDMALADSLASVATNVDRFLVESLDTINLVEKELVIFSSNQVIQESGRNLLSSLAPDELAVYATDVKLDEAQCDLLVASLNNAELDAEARSNLLQNMCQLLQDPDNARMLLARGGLNALAAVMRDNMDDESIFFPASKAFLKLSSLAGDMDTFLQDPVMMEAMCNIMKASEMFSTPMDVGDLTKAMNAVARMKLQPGNVKQILAANPITSLLNVLGTSKESSLLTQAARLMGKISADSDGLAALSGTADIRALILAMRNNINNQEFLKFGVYLLGNLATKQELKGIIGIEGGVQLIIQIIQMYGDNIPLLENSAFTVAELCRGNKVNVNFVVACQGIPLMISLLNDHRESEYLCENAMATLSTLCPVSDSHREEIIKEGGAQSIVDTILNNFDALQLVIAGLRTLSLLAFNRRANTAIVRAGGVQAIVAGMTVHETNKSLLFIAVKVLFNLSADPDPANQAILAEEGAVQAVATVLESFPEDGPLEYHSLTCLLQLAKRPTNASMMLQQNVPQHIFTCLEAMKYEPRICGQGVALILQLTGCPDRKMLLDIVPSMANVAEPNMTVKPVVGPIAMTVGRLSYSGESSAQLDQGGVVQLLMNIFRSNSRDAQLTGDCLQAFSELCRSKEVAVKMVDMTLKSVITAFQSHVLNPRVVAMGFLFLRNLCSHKDCSEFIPKHPVIGACLNLFRQYNNNPDLIARGLSALENIAKGSNKVKDHMKVEGVVQVCKGLQNTHATVDMIVTGAERVLTALETFDLGPDLAMEMKLEPIARRKLERPKQEEKAPIKVLPKDIKNFLQSGELMTKHSKSAPPRPRHVYVDNDLKFLIWKEPKKTDIPDKNKMKIHKIKSVEKGCVTPQLQRKAKFSGKALAKSDCSFAVFGRDRTVDLEASSEILRDKWVHALETLVAFKKAQKLMASSFGTS